MTKVSKKVMSALFAAVLMVSLATFATGCGGDGGSSGGGKYTPGTYTGEGTGMGGTIEVTLTIADGDKITVDNITDPGETVGFGGKEAIDDGTFKEQIEAAQGAEIDGVSGATITTTGVKDAVEDALAQAAGE